MKSKVTAQGNVVPETPDDPLFWALHEAFRTNSVKAHNLNVEVEKHEREIRSLLKLMNDADNKAQAVVQHAERMGWDLKMPGDSK